MSRNEKVYGAVIIRNPELPRGRLVEKCVLQSPVTVCKCLGGCDRCIIADDDDALVCIECGGRNRLFSKITEIS